MGVCILFMSSTWDIVINTCADAITDHSQSAKNIDPYYNSQLYLTYPGHRKPVLILPNGLSRPGERALNINKFLPQMGFEPTTSSSIVQCLTTRSPSHRFYLQYF